MSNLKESAIALIKEKAEKTKSTDLFIQARNHKKPKSFSIGYSGNRQGNYTPDAIVHVDSKKDFYTIEETLTKANAPEQIYKWILFSMEAKKAKGDFYMIVSKAKEAEYKKLIDWKQIDVTLLSL